MAQSRKITDLNRATPHDEFAFIVATGVSNFQLSYKDLAEYSSINRGTGSFLDTLTISGVPVLTGVEYIDADIDNINNEITEINNQINQIINNPGAPGSAGAFTFFSNIENNIGPITKTFYDTPTSDTYLSGVTVDTASDLKVYLRWDGPPNHYMGTGFIDGVEIPSNQVTELGSYTRRFEGYLDNLSFTGQQFISGYANGVSSIVNLTELGAGPTPLSLSIDNISNATPKAGHNLGATHLKGGDQINIYAVFDNNDIDTIEVYDSGISDGIAAQSYALNDTGDGNYTATIPITVTNSRSNAQSVAIIAKNNFGTLGTETISSNSVDLDQLYPVITASDPTSYNGRTDGLRENESTSFANTVSNWSNSTDFIDYSALSNDISIDNDGTFENPKTVNYVGGIYNNSDNIEITASRNANGALDSESVTVKIANGPVITGIDLDSLATSATSPNIVGTSEVKGGDVVNAEIYVVGKGVTSNNIDLSIANSGLSNGSQTNYSSYSVSTLPDGSFKYTVPINVTSSTSRDGAQAITATAKNNFGTLSDAFTSSASATVNNSVYPAVSISSIAYPGSQEALKNTESATVSNSASNYDSISYSSGNGELSITNSTTFEASKTATRAGGSYNISNDNFTITATKNSNGRVVSTSTVVYIANTAMSLSINNLASVLSSSPTGLSDNFNLVSDQQYISVPTLSTDGAQTSPSSLSIISSGTNTNSNAFRITVSDSDTKGTFTWDVSATNLAGIVTTSISVNPNYVLAGFSSRTITASPTSLGAGLASIGTTVADPANLSFENVSEGGTAPNGGTTYTYQSYPNGTQLDNSYDVDNKFTVCDSNGLTSSTGDHVFNLDKLNRAANTSTSNPAQFVIEED